MGSLNTQIAKLARDTSRGSGLVSLVHPVSWKDIHSAGYKPAMYNKIYGGGQWGPNPSLDVGDAASSQMFDNNTAQGVGQVAGTFYISQGFRVSEGITIPGVWLKVYKIVGAVANAYNLTVSIWSNSGSAPSLSLGTCVPVPLKRLTTRTSGEWQYFELVTPLALTADTQYHIVATTGVVDASNYVVWKSGNVREYPHGFIHAGTSVPAWTPSTTQAACFVVPNPAAARFLRADGSFSGRLVSMDGAPVNQIKALVGDVANFYSGNGLITHLVRVSNAQKGKIIADLAHGIDRNRVQISTDAITGFARLSIWRSDGTRFDLNATSVDLSVASFADVAFVLRATGDGADYAQLWVNGRPQASASGQSFGMDPAFAKRASHWLGGGFVAAPTWTVDTNTSTLPSTQGWTWTGTATEANAMSIQNGKLYQNRAGYASGDTGFYSRAGGLSNTNGWTVSAQLRIVSSSGTLSTSGAILYVQDGAKAIAVYLHQNTLVSFGSAVDLTRMVDLSSDENTVTICGRGSDYWVFLNGELIIDGTGRLTTASANNLVQFGDVVSAAGENADVVWSRVQFFAGSVLLPQGSNGMSLHESAVWANDAGALLSSLYNLGQPESVKRLCGVNANYVRELPSPVTSTQREVWRWVDVTASRAMGVNYYNTTDEMLEVMLQTPFQTSAASQWETYIDDQLAEIFNIGQSGAGAGGRVTMRLSVPPGSRYRANNNTIANWLELRKQVG